MSVKHLACSWAVLFLFLQINTTFGHRYCFVLLLFGALSFIPPMWGYKQGKKIWVE